MDDNGDFAKVKVERINYNTYIPEIMPSASVEDDPLDPTSSINMCARNI
jgi:hypothetical protein